jgi:beta-xylosidase
MPTSLHRFPSLVALVLFTALWWLPATAGAQPTWRDDFNGPGLDPGWTFVDDTSSGWSLSDRPGFLRLYTSTTREVDGNILLRAPARGHFAIETRLIFVPQANFDFAGLIVFQDALNYFQFGRAYCDSPGVCVGNGFYFDNVSGGIFTGSNHAAANTDPEAFLRLELKGRTLTAFLSGDGRTWRRFASHVLPPRFQIRGVGLTSSDHFSPTLPIPADFDYFLFQGVPAQARRPGLR